MIFGLHFGQHSGINIRNIECLQLLKGYHGAPTRTRTADLLITNQLLYQLSYRGMRAVLPLLLFNVKHEVT